MVFILIVVVIVYDSNSYVVVCSFDGGCVNFNIDEWIINVYFYNYFGF